MASSERDDEERDEEAPAPEVPQEPDRGSWTWHDWVQPIGEGLLVIKLILEMIHGSGG